eukprot:366221-Chlamydomonas_euryale.AAC.4
MIVMLVLALRIWMLKAPHRLQRGLFPFTSGEERCSQRSTAPDMSFPMESPHASARTALPATRAVSADHSRPRRSHTELLPHCPNLPHACSYSAACDSCCERRPLTAATLPH